MNQTEWKRKRRVGRPASGDQVRARQSLIAARSVHLIGFQINCLLPLSSKTRLVGQPSGSGRLGGTSGAGFIFKSNTDLAARYDLFQVVAACAPLMTAKYPPNLLELALARARAQSSGIGFGRCKSGPLPPPEVTSERKNTKVNGSARCARRVSFGGRAVA